MRKNTGRKFLLLLLVAVMLAGAVWWVGARDGGSAGTAATTAKVTRRSFASTVLATGAIRPQVGAEVKVGARISGRVVKLHVNVGDQVTRGQILAELEKEELQAQVALCQAYVEEADAQLEAIKRQRPKETARAQAAVDEAKATVRLARLNWDRKREMYGKQAATVHELDTARKELDTASSRLSVAEAELALAQTRLPDDVKVAQALAASKRASLDSARARLGYATIHASISGTIASVSTQEGETVSAGLNVPTFVTIIDLGRLQADTFVDEVDIGKVRVGQRAVVTVDTFPDREFEGKVTAIYPKAVLQDNVVNYDVVVDITTPYRGFLRPEMTTNVTIFLAARDGVLAVPAKAIKRDRGRSVVYVPGDGGPKVRQVKVGWRDGQWIEIVAGLQEGELVLLDAPARSDKPSEVKP